MVSQVRLSGFGVDEVGGVVELLHLFVVERISIADEPIIAILSDAEDFDILLLDHDNLAAFNLFDAFPAIAILGGSKELLLRVCFLCHQISIFSISIKKCDDKEGLCTYAPALLLWKGSVNTIKKELYKPLCIHAC